MNWMSPRKSLVTISAAQSTLALANIRRLKDGYDVLDKLYDDNDLNCDNFAQAVREYRCSREVITAVANLYLRQQIMLDTY